ncbi:MAG: GMP synthase (glutamine-hydrolyzing) [Pirellulaceae bacterium]|jgi:GMP synthase (glutamine-hydrolysing)
MSKFLLLQIRDSDDPIREQEIGCFSRALGCEDDDIATSNLLFTVPTQSQVESARAVFIGGSGNYSVVERGEWLPPALQSLRQLCSAGKPVFASCWGFQAIALALGGKVVTDLDRAELGSLTLKTTPAAAGDPLFASLAPSFVGQLGHQDIVDELPADAICLASSDKVENEAFRLRDKPIYATQFHPELNRQTLIDRVKKYPQYVEKIARTNCDEFVAACREAPKTDELLRRFVELFVSPS